MFSNTVTTSLSTRELVTLLFSSLGGMCIVCHGLLLLLLVVIGRQYYVIVVLPGHLLYYL